MEAQDETSETEKQGEDIEEMDICSWCADEYRQGQDLLLCDDCPRVFCDRCVSLAHGSGSKGDKLVKALLTDDGKWSCIHCEPTLVLESMRSFLAESNEKDGQLSADDDGVDTSMSSPISKGEDLEDLLDKLSSLEDELEETTMMLEADAIEKKRVELAHTPTAELEEQLEDWIQEMKDRYSRCADAIGIIQDDLGKFIDAMFAKLRHHFSQTATFTIYYRLQGN